MNKEIYEEAFSDLMGGMYGNVDGGLSYFMCISEYSSGTKVLILNQIKVDPCV